jgi:hypothetical protein
LSDFRCDLFELCLLVFAFDMCGVVLRDGWWCNLSMQENMFVPVIERHAIDKH